MYGSAMSILMALCILLNVGHQTIKSQYRWHQDAIDQWSVTLRDGGKLYVILESGDRPLFLVRSVCLDDPSGYTIAQKQWYAGDRFVESVNCLNQMSHIDVPPLFEGLEPLPLRAQELFRRNREQQPGSPDGEVPYAQGILYRL